LELRWSPAWFNPNASTPSEVAALAVFAQQMLEQRVNYDAGETASEEGSIYFIK